MPCSVLPSNTKIENQELRLEELDKCWLSPEAYLNEPEAHVDERVDLLVKKMMANQVHVVGWSDCIYRKPSMDCSCYFNEAIHPPEVVNEVQLQFSSGMQTVAVIPAVPHGVIQLGSSLTIKYGTAGWKERYYKEKFATKDHLKLQSLKKEVVKEYTQGLCWV